MESVDRVFYAWPLPHRIVMSKRVFERFISGR